jgi:hypothetical protein
MILLYHSWTCIQKEVSLNIIKILAHPFIAKLCTIANQWNQPRFPLIIEWIKKMWYIQCSICQR